MDLVVYAVPLFILAMLIELIFGWRAGRNTYRVNDAVSSLFLGSLSQARKFVTLGVGGVAYHFTAEYFSLARLPGDHWTTWVLAFVLYDFCYYWLHRLGHERAILWAAHVAHHQSEDYNLSTALRQTSTGFLFSWLFYLPLFAVGVPASVVVTVGSLNLIYQFWVHTQHVGKLGWYEGIFVTPSNHRVHHAQNDVYLDRNYGGVFILWDRLFGTFQEELDNEPPIYGIRGALHSFSPLRALTHVYVDLWLDCWRTKRWRDKLRVWVARTGWRPEDLAADYPRRKTDLDHFQRFDPPTGAAARSYALFQLFAVVGMLAVLQGGVLPGYAQGALLALAMLLCGVCTALWLDGVTAPAHCLAADAARIALFSLLLWLGAATLKGGLLLPFGALYLLLNLCWLPFLARQRWAGRVEALSTV